MILCIDTCTEHAGVALVRKAGAVYKPLPEGRYAESLLAVIEKVFKAAKAKPVDLTGVIVIKGPGSFTSLRVGIAIVNTFAHQLKIPIVGLRTDEWWLHRTDERPVVYLQSMNRDEVYTHVILIPTKSGEESPQITQLHSVAGEILRRYAPQNDIRYLGQLSPEHKADLPSKFRPAHELKSPRETWLAVAQSVRWPRRQKTYMLIEPFYGKEPTITKSKHHSTKICLSK